MTESQKPSLGRLESVDLREAWKGEATDFTPWLALPENIELLGDAIGVELEVEAQEKDVGPFRADILCRDMVSNHYVLIENQLERTDHTHLGQLLTYAAGLDAVTIIWVSSRFTDEHRAALDWLNEATGSEFDFFGLEIELWKIGGSAMAPKFNVVSSPNDWSRAVREQAAQSGQLSEFQRLHLEFWTQFRTFLEEQGSGVRTNRPSKDHWTCVPIGRSFFTLSAWNGMRDDRSGVNLEMTGPDAKAHYGLIEANHRDEVERRLAPLGEINWRRLPNAKQSQVQIVRASTPSNPETWPELDEWVLKSLETMDALFRPMVRQLDASEYEAKDGEDLGGDDVAERMDS